MDSPQHLPGGDVQERAKGDDRRTTSQAAVRRFFAQRQRHVLRRPERQRYLGAERVSDVLCSGFRGADGTRGREKGQSAPYFLWLT